MTKLTKEQVDMYVAGLKSIRLVLASIPMDALQEMRSNLSNDSAFGVFFDPTAFLDGSRFDANRVGVDALDALIGLKEVWGKDEDALRRKNVSGE